MHFPNVAYILGLYIYLFALDDLSPTNKDIKLFNLGLFSGLKKKTSLLLLNISRKPIPVLQHSDKSHTLLTGGVPKDLNKFYVDQIKRTSATPRREKQYFFHYETRKEQYRYPGWPVGSGQHYSSDNISNGTVAGASALASGTGASTLTTKYPHCMLQ